MTNFTDDVEIHEDIIDMKIVGEQVLKHHIDFEMMASEMLTQKSQNLVKPIDPINLHQKLISEQPRYTLVTSSKLIRESKPEELKAL